jgi:hypothetical protein
MTTYHDITLCHSRMANCAEREGKQVRAHELH